MSDSDGSPLLRSTLQLILVIGVVTFLFFGRGFLLPIVVAGILSLIVDPIDEKLRSWGWKPGFAIFGAFFVLLVFFVGLFFAISQQMSSLVESWPQLERALSSQINAFRESSGLGGLIPELPSFEDDESVMEDLPVTSESVMSILSATLSTMGDFVLVLVYVILMLAQKQRLRSFIIRLAPDEKRGLAHQTMNEGREVVQKYLRGQLILIATLAALYSAGFLIIGMEYAILIAILVAVMSLIPYLGNILGGLIAVAIAFAGGGGSTAIFGVLITMSIAQFLESYFLTPLVVGDEVNLNPLTTILCVVGLAILWGPIGAVIAIPLTGIVRIVFSHVRGLEDYAFLMGQEKAKLPQRH
ncbi:AI-2E family transporter [Neolewinella antarctica]|uniref:PurR-regulated permease PerM n=1 Tax=Neolewinella antarctica TaxID=442734 RepID=A0ABX0XED9_9BACT|nr:AI-2E family transporter [Neolewinella antarctica]NJC27122.1 putative PurR-regulated permease PerM [Neolewinella antarctica]